MNLKGSSGHSQPTLIPKQAENYVKYLKSALQDDNKIKVKQKNEETNQRKDQNQQKQVYNEAIYIIIWTKRRNNIIMKW